MGEALSGGGDEGRYGMNGFLYVDPGTTKIEFGGSKTLSPCVYLERLDAHRLTLDYNGGRSDGVASSEQWLLEGEYWKTEYPQKGSVLVKRLDKVR